MGRNCCFFGASTCLLRNWMKKSFFKELSNITAIECLALAGLSPPRRGAASQPRCSFRSGTAARAGSAPSRGLQGRATWLPQVYGQKLTFSCRRWSWDSSPLLTPLQQLCRPPRRAAASPHAPGEEPYGARGLSAVSAQSPNTHRENVLEEQLLPSLPHLPAHGLLAGALGWLTPC